MTDFWCKLTENRSGWFWIANSLRNGDLYHVCSLAAAFKKHHGKEKAIYLVVARRSQLKIAELFQEMFDEVIIAEQVPILPEDWDAFFQATGLPRFGRDVPLLTHPDLYSWGRSAIEIAAQTHRTWMDIYKKILRLPGFCEPSVPTVNPDLDQQAWEFCIKADIPTGRSVVLFPYAQSLPMPASACFAKLAHDLQLEGLTVYTSVAEDERPIEGTIGLQIPFNILIQVSEFCGWIVAIRSGICDITSSARCRKTYVYPSFETLLAWSVNALDLARDAQEISYPFTGNPSHFSELVRSESNLTSLAAPSRRLSSYLFHAEGPGIQSVSFFAIAKDDLRCICKNIERGIRSALIIYDVPSRKNCRLHEQALSLAVNLGQYAKDMSVYACRDALTMSFFEEIGGFSLSSGHYLAADYWHSLIVVANKDGTRIIDLLPSPARDALLLPSQAISSDVAIRMGDFFGSAEHVGSTSQARPLSLEGVQLLEGWSGLEAWGLWSEGLQPTIKLCAKDPFTYDSTLYVEACGCVSPTFPELSFSIWANGIFIDRVSIDKPFDNHFEVPLGRHVCGEKKVTIVFRIDDVRSPLEQGSGRDSRRLGLGLVAVKLRNTPSLSHVLDAEYVGTNCSPKEVLPQQGVTLDAIIALGSSFDSPEHRLAINDRKPLNVNGLLLKDGWWGLESWGIWGRGNIHSFDILFDRPPSLGFSLQVAIQPLVAGGSIIVEIDKVEVSRSDCSTRDARIMLASLDKTSPSDLEKTAFEVTLKTSKATSPFDISDGVNSDRRQIGVGLLWIKVIAGSVEHRYSQEEPHQRPSGKM